jgi:hypothetical protein
MGFKLKTWQWIIISIVSFMFPLSAMFIITRILITPALSWWWFFGTLIGEIVIGMIIGVIILVLKLKKIEPIKTKLDVKTAREKAVYQKKYDSDNPDNFIIKKQIINNVGTAGKPITRVLHLQGEGSETEQEINAVINLDKPKLEISWFSNATESQIKEIVMKTAEYPESEIREERVVGYDPFGRELKQTTVRKVSQIEKEIKEEKKEAELKQMF